MLKKSPDVYDIYLLWKAYEWQEDVKVSVKQAGATSLWENVAFPLDPRKSDICPLDSAPSLSGLSQSPH